MTRIKSRLRKKLKRGMGALFLVVDRVGDRLKKSNGLVEAEDIRKVLIAEMQGIGDALAALPAAKALKERFPKARLTLILQKAAVDLFRSLSIFDEIIPLGINKSRLGMVDFLRTLPRLRKDEYDLFVIPSWSLRHTAVSLVVRSKARLGYLHDHSFRMVYHNDYPVEVRRISCARTAKYSKEEHIITRALKTIEPLGIEVKDGRYEIEALPGQRAEASALLRKYGLDNGNQEFIVIAPAAVWKGRTWPLNKWKRLIELISRKRDVVFFVIGSREDREMFSSLCDGVRTFDLCGRTGLPQLMGVMDKSLCSIGVDSGPMHLAAALGKPVVALFGPNIPEVCGPKGRHCAVVQKEMACRPCDQEFCPVPEGKRCMDLISPEDVLVAYESLMSKTNVGKD